MLPLCAQQCLTKASCSLLLGTPPGAGDAPELCDGFGAEPRAPGLISAARGAALQGLCVTGGGFSNATGHKSTAGVSKEQ